VINPELIGDYWVAKAMQNNWIKPDVAFLNLVPSGIQTMVMLLITEIVTSLMTRSYIIENMALSTEMYIT